MRPSARSARDRPPPDAQTTSALDQAAAMRAASAHIRDESADRRDRAAAGRDDVAKARDLLAERLDAEIERLERECQDGAGPTGLQALLRAAGNRRRAAESRTRAAAQRGAAALDREEAALDRRQAALDRATVAEELAAEGFDRLTGALRRSVGLAAIQREMDRTADAGEELVVAFVKIDGLKTVNEELGPETGDDLLRETATAIRSRLRSYDVLTRVGGDEFACSLSGQDAASATVRFHQVSTELAAGRTCASFTVGFANRRPSESVHALVGRAADEMRRARGRADD